MRVLILGAGGQLGRALGPALRARGHEPIGQPRAAVDLTVAEQVVGALDRYQPSVVVNAAAYTAVDRAELEAERAFAVNAYGLRPLVHACAARGLPLCHVSTDFVFGGPGPTPRRPWRETDPPQPLGVYARSKRAGELEYLHGGGPGYLVRTAWLYGERGPNFVLTMARLARRHPRLRVVADQVGTPTWTGHLAPALAELIETGAFGVYHLTNQGQTTWHGLAQAVVAGLGLDVPVDPISTAEFGAPAPRPAYSVLDNAAWRQLGRPPLPPWEAGLRAYLEAERAGAVADALRAGDA